MATSDAHKDGKPTRPARLSRPNDARAMRSREALRKAMLTLIEDHPFDEISIRDITREAGVSYPVFFRRYQTKEDILSDVAANEVRELFRITLPALSSKGARSSLEQLCSYVQSHKSLWRTLLTTGATGKMREEFIKASAEVADNSARANPWLPVSLASRFVTSGIFEILAWWLHQPDEYPTQNVVILLEELVVRPTLQPRNIRLD